MSKNKRRRFKHTPIPHRTKSGVPMSYYILSEDGKEQIKVSRAECLARHDETDSRYPQRWFVDEESGLVVRLPRNETSEKVARENMRSVWREKKYQERRCRCVLNGTPQCDGWKTTSDGTRECDFCQRKNVSRTVEIDMFFGRDDDDDGTNTALEPVDPCDISAVAEDNALLATLNAALAALTQEDRDLLTAIFRDNMTERQLAPQLGLKEPKSVNKRKQRILNTLRRNEALKIFFE